jgi:hypothetical protein
VLTRACGEEAEPVATELQRVPYHWRGRVGGQVTERPHPAKV